jgi:hypothetical protein
MSMADKREPIAGTRTQANRIYPAGSRNLDMIEPVLRQPCARPCDCGASPAGL